MTGRLKPVPLERHGRRKDPRRETAPAIPERSGAELGAHRFSRALWLAHLLRQRIISGFYPPGERIREADLRAEFGFSNGPIRQALQTVVADGLAERAPWQSVRIRLLSQQQIIELFQVRLALLEYAAELAARNASPAVVEKAALLKRSIDEGLSRIKAGAGHPSFNGQLSQWLLASAGNQALRDIWDKTMQQTLIYVNASLMRGQGSKSRALIHRLIDRIGVGDVAGARTAARELTRQTLVDLGIDGTV
jgi:DNA-binding GntR family transcriptional regulator